MADKVTNVINVVVQASPLGTPQGLGLAKPPVPLLEQKPDLLQGAAESRFYDPQLVQSNPMKMRNEAKRAAKKKAASKKKKSSKRRTRSRKV